MSAESLTLSEAVFAIQHDKLIIFPTETFFALGGNPFSPEVLQNIYSVKQRKPSHPLPLIASDVKQAKRVVACIPTAASMLIAQFWPGPLTIVLPAVPTLPQLLTGGTGKVAIRIPACPEARKLCLACDTPLISSSANLSGRPPVRAPEDLDPALLGRVSGLYNPPGVEICGQRPSTIVEPVGEDYGLALRVLRAGAVPASTLEAHGFTCLSLG